MTEPAGAPIVVLEDDRATAVVIRRVLEGAGIANPVERFARGADAVAYLEKSASGGAPRPVLCVLDQSLPDMTGLEVLERIRANPGLADMAVVMLSGSGDDDDIEAAYRIGLDAYLVKPAGIHGLPDVIRQLGLRYQLLPREP